MAIARDREVDNGCNQCGGPGTYSRGFLRTIEVVFCTVCAVIVIMLMDGVARTFATAWRLPYVAKPTFNGLPHVCGTLMRTLVPSHDVIRLENDDVDRAGCEGMLLAHCRCREAQFSRRCFVSWSRHVETTLQFTSSSLPLLLKTVSRHQEMSLCARRYCLLSC